MCQVVACRRFKTVENSQTVSRKSGHGRLLEVVVYERFQYKALTENIFGVLVFASSSIVVTYIPAKTHGKYQLSYNNLRHDLLETFSVPISPLLPTFFSLVFLLFILK